MALDLSTLNDTQLKAVQWDDGPLLVLAGPGSGKTRVLTYRIARLVEMSPKDHFRILALTFTNKAATEMRSRIQELVPTSSERVLLSTFHSFAGDILRQHGHLIGLKPDFTVLGQDADRMSLLDDAISACPNAANNDRYTGEKLLPLIARLLDHAADDQTIERLIGGLSSEDRDAVPSIYQKYRALMVERNSLDFGGLIAEALGLLRSRSAVRRQLQKIYKYVCVDEFQDTNHSQYEILINLVNPESRNVFVVADDDQVIYQWNGANPERLKELQKQFDSTVLQLPENYRCPPEVIDLANLLIVNNIGRAADKRQLIAAKKDTGVASVRVQAPFEDFDAEASWVASDIASRSPKERARCAVLARTKGLLEKVVQHLTADAVPAYLAMRKDEFASAPMQWLHAILRLANARQDREQLRRVCKSFFALEGLDLNVKDIASSATSFQGDYLRSFAHAALARPELEQQSKRLLQKSLPKLSERLDFAGFAKDAFVWFASIPQVNPDTEASFTEYADELATWNELVAEINGQFGAEQVTLNLLLQELDLRSKASKPPVNAVPCFTIHSAKGLEFDHVYLVGLVEDQLPSWAAVKRGDSSREMQEERRNCFVAITRTQETLTLTYSRTLNGWAKQPSRFLREMHLV
jgi:DNA helicase-2/ATP-dependent DNA helicase PcrA